MTLEQQLFQQLAEGKEIGKDISLVDAVLIADGVEDPIILEEYREKIQELYFDIITDEDFDFDPERSNDEQLLKSADSLYASVSEHRQLGTDRGIHSLQQVIDKLYDNIPGQGLDCFGATLIYSILAEQLGLDILVVEKERHILNRIKRDKKTYDIDHKLGDKIEQQDSPEGVEHPLISLVAFTYIKRGDIENNKDNEQEAIELYTKAIIVDPELSDRAYLHRAVVYMEAEVYELAKADYEKAISLNPNEIKSHVGLAFVEYHLFNYDKAMEQLSKAENIEALNPDIYYVKALIQYEQGKKNDALRNSAIAIGLEQDHEGANHLSNFILKEKRREHLKIIRGSRTLH